MMRLRKGLFKPFLRVLGSYALIIISIFITIFCFSNPVAYGKSVTIEWKALDEAIAYEIQIKREDKVVLTKKIKETSFVGDLDFGYYTYQVRAYDKAQRPGEWSSEYSLVAMPSKPEITYPEDGQTAGLYSDKSKLVLKWKEQKGISLYSIEVKKGSAVIYRGKTRGTSLDIKVSQPGEYSWTVTPVIEGKSRDPASGRKKIWRGPTSGERDFALEKRRLDKPVLLYPVDEVIAPKDSRKLVLRWKAIDGAEKYEVIVISAKTKGRKIAKSTVKEYKFRPTTNELPVKLPGEGVYRWKVRALANIDSSGTPGAIGPKSETKFKVDKNAEFFDGTGYVALSTMLAPYSYRVVSPSTGFEGTTDSQAVTFRLSGEYWVAPQWGVGAGVESTSFLIVGQNFNRKAVELTLRTRIKFSEDKYGWYLYPKLGFEGREYFQLTPSTSVDPSSSLQFWSLGPSVGIDIRKQFSEKFSLGAKTIYYLPLTLVGNSTGGKISGSASKRNFGVGLQGLYWFTSRWGGAAGVFAEQRSIGYSGGSGQEEIFMDGKYFFGSIIFNFGN